METNVCGAHLEICNNPVAFVTGGAQGFGYAIAEALLKAKYKVYIGDINEQKGGKVADDLKKKYGQEEIYFSRLDVTDKHQYTKAYEEALRVFKRVDVLVNNAGVLCENEVIKTLMVNVVGTVHGCQIALQYMGTKNGGKGGIVINVASILGLIPCPYAPVYSASKHGVVGLTRSYGTPQVLGMYGVHFAAVCPSFINTELLHDLESKLFDMRKVPIPEFMDPAFVAEGVLKLIRERRNSSTLLVTKQKGYQYVGLGELEGVDVFECK